MMFDDKSKKQVKKISAMRIAVCAAAILAWTSPVQATSFFAPSGQQSEEQQQQVVLEDIPVEELLRQESGIANTVDAKAETSTPKSLQELQEIPGYSGEADEDSDMPFNIRKEAMKEAALSYGARGGLAARSFEINKQLDSRSSYLDRVFDFRQLLISAPSGFMIES